MIEFIDNNGIHYEFEINSSYSEIIINLYVNSMREGAFWVSSILKKQSVLYYQFYVRKYFLTSSGYYQPEVISFVERLAELHIFT